MAATIRDVAREAGVAVCTVSFAMNGSAHVSEETKKRIFDAIEKLNYRPNRSARGLVTKRTENIGLVVAETADGLENSILLDVIKGLGQAIGANHYDLLLSFQKSESERLDDHLLDVYRKQSADGLVLMGTATFENTYKELAGHRFPFVVLGRPREERCHSVDADNEQGAYLAVQYLVEKGHRKIGFITPCALDADVSRDRLNGYKKAMIELAGGYQADWIQIGGFHPESGFQETETLLQLPERPTAIIAGRDMLAARSLEKAKELGFRVPEDVAVVGFDYTVIAQISRPSITSVELPMREMGFEAGKLLLQLIDGKLPYDDIQKIVLPCTIREQESA